MNFNSYIKGNSQEDKKIPENLEGLKYKQMQKGKGKYSLCTNCNNNTGSWYGEAYCNFSNTVASL